MSLKSEILDAVAARLGKIKAANGYSIDVKRVYYDKIPMGIQLNSYQLPVIFILDASDYFELEHSCLKGSWDFRLQLWHSNREGDFTMLDFVRQVMKNLYADSPTAERSDAFRALHPSVYELVPISVSTDLNMIDANRVSELSFQVRYRTKLFNL